MIDNLAIGISHGLLMLTAWLLLRRPDLDHEPGPADPAAPLPGTHRGLTAKARARFRPTFGKHPRA